MDGASAREGLRFRRAGARQRDRCRAGARQGRQVPGAAGADLRQYRRLSHLRPRRRAALGQSRRACRHLHDAGDSRRGRGRDDAHHAHRPLPRRRAARGRLRDRDHGRSRGAQARHRSGRAAAAQHHPGRARCRTRPGSSTPIDSGDFAQEPRRRAGRWPIMPASRARREESKARGKLRGIGVSNTIEASSGGMLEHAAAPLRSRAAR